MNTEYIKSNIELTLHLAAESDEEDYFSTYEYVENNDIWFQVAEDCVNIQYPFSEDPILKLSELGISTYPEFELISWVKNLFITISIDDTMTGVSQFVVEYFKKVFDIDINQNTFNYISYEDYPETEDDDWLEI